MSAFNAVVGDRDDPSSAPALGGWADGPLRRHACDPASASRASFRPPPLSLWKVSEPDSGWARRRSFSLALRWRAQRLSSMHPGRTFRTRRGAEPPCRGPSERSWLGCHFPALVSALLTGPGALLAMLRLVFGAFVGARLTDLGAHPAQFRRVGRAARHELSGQTANVGAVPVELNALSHHLDVVLPQTRCRAGLACCDAFVAGRDAGFILPIFHVYSYFQYSIAN